MDDPRIEWLRDHTYQALDIIDQEVFDDLLNREDGEAERAIAKFLNETPDDQEPAILFYKHLIEEEEEIEVECGEKYSVKVGGFSHNFSLDCNFNFK